MNKFLFFIVNAALSGLSVFFSAVSVSLSFLAGFYLTAGEAETQNIALIIAGAFSAALVCAIFRKLDYITDPIENEWDS